MSSSDKFPDWSVFPEREVPFDVELLSPALEMAAVLQRYRSDLDAAQQKVETVHRNGLLQLAQQAVFVIQLAAALDRYRADLKQASLDKVHKHLRVLKDQMLDALKQAGLEIDIPTGKSFDEVADLVDVEGWRHHEDFSSEVVAEMLEPIVTHRGKLIRPGRVVMGAPLQEKSTEQ